MEIFMELHETDRNKLQEFVANAKIENEFTQDSLILYNFASDCRYSTHIQPELLRHLLPFYLRASER